MIHLLQARNFRMLRSNVVSLQPFQVLVGQNASGKSTLMLALQFIGDVLRGGVRSAVERLTPSFYDLCFDPSEPIELAAELSVPGNGDRKRLRYEIEVGIDAEQGLRVLRENLFIIASAPESQPSLFGEEALARPTIHKRPPAHWRRVVSKTEEGRDYFRDEKTDWNNVFRFGVEKAALGSLPEDPERFPLTIAARRALRDGLRMLALDAEAMRGAAPPGGPSKMALNGANLPHVVRALMKRDTVLFAHWVQHVAAAVEGLEKVEVWEREEDRYLALRVLFKGGHKQPVPSWMLSDGTLRLMALTLLSYSATPDDVDIYLIEEPENGLHPLAIQVAYEALSAPLPHSQVLCATHSPVFLAQASLDQALVFRRSPEGYAMIRRGAEIQELEEWSGRISLPDLFVTGILA
jgi:hypothetical protein